MDMQKKKFKITFTLNILVIVLLLSFIGVIYGNVQTVKAIYDTNIVPDSTNLDEMLLEGYEEDTTGDGNVFDKDIFWELISQITGIENPNSSTLDHLTEPKTSADFRALNNNKDVVVQIGGKKWIASYLSTNKSGEPILTFWLAYSNTVDQWHIKAQNDDGKYPSNMYGTSSVRAIVLNNGGVVMLRHIMLIH